MKTLKKEMYSPVPQGTYSAYITIIASLGLQTSTYGDSVATRETLGLGYALDVKTQDGNPLIVTDSYTASLNPKAKLYGVAQAAMGGVPDEMSPDELLGKGVSVTVVHRTDSKGQVWANIESVESLLGEQPRPCQEMLVFDLENPDPKVYQKLPARFRKMIENRVPNTTIGATNPDGEKHPF